MVGVDLHSAVHFGALPGPDPQAVVDDEDNKAIMRVFQGKPMSDEDRLKALSEGEMHHHHHHVVVPKDASPWTRWRAHVFCTFEFPEYSRTAWFLCGFFLLVILMALITFCVESIPSIYKNPKLKKQYHEVEYFIIAIFTLEYLVKLVTAPDTWRFFRSPIALLDLAAVLPFYIELVILGAGGSLSGTAAGTRVLRVLRLIHFIRIVQLGARLQYIHLVVKAIVNSVDVLAMLFVLFVLLQTFFATIIYFAENGNNPKFDSIPQLMYFAAQTMTGVGYGDLVPTSAAAKWITSLCIVSGVICLALPISALGANFSSLYNEFKAKKGAAARGEALPNMRKLLAAVDMHNMAITDVIEHIKQLQSKISSCCLRVQQLAPRAKLVADVSSSDNDAMVRVLELHDLFNTMLTVLLDAKNHMALLETLSEVGGAAHSNDLQKALATCFLGTQNLSGWSKNHAFMADQLLSVQGELAKIRAHVDVLRKVD